MTDYPTMRTAHIYTETQQSRPVEILTTRSASFRSALRRFGFRNSQIDRILPDLDCGREMRIDGYTIQPR